MQGLLILLGLVLLALPFAVVGLLVSTSRLRRRVESLEAQVLRLLTSEAGQAAFARIGFRAAD